MNSAQSKSSGMPHLNKLQLAEDVEPDSCGDSKKLATATDTMKGDPNHFFAQHVPGHRARLPCPSCHRYRYFLLSLQSYRLESSQAGQYGLGSILAEALQHEIGFVRAQARSHKAGLCHSFTLADPSRSGDLVTRTKYWLQADPVHHYRP